MKKVGNIDKWSFSEMTSNSNGKTSATSTMGSYIILIGGLCFLLGCIDKMFFAKDMDIITQSIAFTSLGTAMLMMGKHRSTALDIASVKSETPTESTTPTE
jgi:hypothetical protein